ncbi:MAG: VWA domain-containing protein [Sulfuricellaceae bacterium]|nr:VWA domain-containing protein [Sulfuricellaceae bacterium]
MLNLDQPLWLLAIPFVLLAWWLGRRAAPEEDGLPAVRLIHPFLAEGSHAEALRPKPGLGGTSQLGAMLLLILALARPLWNGPWLPPQPEGREIMLLLDNSRSMSITDFQAAGQPVERFSVLKGLVARFAQGRQGDKFGVILFGEQAYTLLPPTFDHDLVSAMVQRLPVGIAGQDTAIGEALALALKQLQLNPKHRPALVLFTDGDSTAGNISPAEAVEVARRMKVPVYAVDIGTDLFGHAARPAIAEEGAIALEQISAATGGRYYRATSPAALASIMEDIGRLEATITPPTKQRERHEWFWLPALLAAAVLSVSRLTAMAKRHTKS